tara:strand:- start:698 stop:1054 length:357 start_codon:yes stop_codon:yes gene_type:complete
MLFFYNFLAHSTYQFKCDLFHLSDNKNLPYDSLDIEIIEYVFLKKIIKKSFGKINIFTKNDLLIQVEHVYNLDRYQTLHLYNKPLGKGGVKIGSFYKVSKNIRLTIEDEEYYSKCIIN